jgi:hypothetical protein
VPDESAVEGEVLALPQLTSENEEESVGRDSNSRLNGAAGAVLYQYPSPSPQLDEDIE